LAETTHSHSSAQKISLASILSQRLPMYTS
jgi:hypothetical protein